MGGVMNPMAGGENVPLGEVKALLMLVMLCLTLSFVMVSLCLCSAAFVRIYKGIEDNNYFDES